MVSATTTKRPPLQTDRASYGVLKEIPSSTRRSSRWTASRRSGWPPALAGPGRRSRPSTMTTPRSASTMSPFASVRSERMASSIDPAGTERIA